MQYLFLIYGEEPTTMPTPAEAGAIMAEYMAFEKAIAEAGVKLGGNALKPVRTATTVKVRDGEKVVTDGPFAETREVLGGYYLLDLPDLDAALEWAAKIPGSWHGSVEVRPVQEFDIPA